MFTMVLSHVQLPYFLSTGQRLRNEAAGGMIAAAGNTSSTALNQQILSGQTKWGEDNGWDDIYLQEA